MQDADERKAGPFGDLQKLAKSFLGWDKTGEKSVRRELQNFVSLRMTADNTSWVNESAFREVFRAALSSSSDNDPANPDRMKTEDGPYSEEDFPKFERNKRIRYTYLLAISQGASDEDIKAALAGGKSGKAAKTEDKADED